MTNIFLFSSNGERDYDKKYSFLVPMGYTTMIKKLFFNSNGRWFIKEEMKHRFEGNVLQNIFWLRFLLNLEMFDSIKTWNCSDSYLKITTEIQKYDVIHFPYLVGRISNNNFEMMDHDPKTTILIAGKTLKSFIKTHLKSQ